MSDKSASDAADTARNVESSGRLTFEEAVQGLKAVGLRAGDTVLVQSDVSRLGRVDGARTREDILAFHRDAFQAVIGPDGTLAVCTAFEDYGRYGTEFHVESSPSRLGSFSEYIRKSPGAVRSSHPIVSVCAVGRRAEEICAAPHFDGFGWDSPWGRLHRIGARLCTLGLSRHDEFGMTFVHYVEQLYGVPYQYNKVFTAPVFENGRQIEGVFTMNVRYLDYGVEYDTSKVKREVLSRGKGQERAYGRDTVFMATCDDLVDVMMASFRRDRYFMLAHPPRFRSGEMPMDGPTGEMQRSVDRGSPH